MSLIQRMIQKMKKYIVEYDSGSIFGRAHYASKKKKISHFTDLNLRKESI